MRDAFTARAPTFWKEISWKLTGTCVGEPFASFILMASIVSNQYTCRRGFPNTKSGGHGRNLRWNALLAHNRETSFFAKWLMESPPYPPVCGVSGLMAISSDTIHSFRASFEAANKSPRHLFLEKDNNLNERLRRASMVWTWERSEPSKTLQNTRLSYGRGTFARWSEQQGLVGEGGRGVGSGRHMFSRKGCR